MFVKELITEYDNNFFNKLRKNWLKTSEILSLLLNMRELIENNIVNVTYQLNDINPFKINYYFIEEELRKKINEKKELGNYFSKLKFDGVDV
jgi:hypothetical protein